MTLEYDTGDTAPQRTRIADALQAELMTLHRDSGWYLRYVGQLPVAPRTGDDDAFGELLNRLRGQAPAAVFVLGASRANPAGMTIERNQWHREIEVSVFVASSHRRDRVRGRLHADVVSAGADAADPGVYAMCEQIDDRLTGWDPGVPGVYRFLPADEGPLIESDRLSVWELRYSVRVDRIRDRWRGLSEMTASIRASHRVRDAGMADAVIEADAEFGQ